MTQAAFAIAGFSGSGKTTLIERLVPRLTARGLVVSLIKHAHHGFDIDHPGKDSFRHREAGCTEVLLASDARWALMHELRGAPEPTLEQLLAVMSPVDLVLIEGFKHEQVPKLEVYRPSLGHPRLAAGDPLIVAVASDVVVETALPRFALTDAEGIAEFIVQHLGLTPRRAESRF
jgi:molybdopterin-guanine dinucleotide biosynthesis adapter protein